VERPLGLYEFDIPRISRQLAHQGGKVVSLMNRPILLKIYLLNASCV